MIKNKASIVRTVILILGLLNNALLLSGHKVLPIDDQTVNEVVTFIITAVTVGQAWWFDNFSKKENEDK